MKKFGIGFLIVIGLLDILVGLEVSGYAKERFIAALKTYGPVERVFDSYYSVLGPRSMLASVETTFPYCHSEAHDLGKIILTKTEDMNQSIELCGYGCTGGCFHGVLMKEFGAADGDHTTLEDVQDKIRTVCDLPATVAKNPNKEGNCPHGVGHALELLADYDLKKALSYCKLFPSRPLEYYCATGVFMEYDLKYASVDTVEKPLLYPCDIYTEFPTACLRYKTYHLKLALGLEGLQKECLSLTGRMRLGCFYGVGFSSVQDIYRDPASLAKICGVGTIDDQKMCIEAISEDVTEFDADVSKQACDSLPDSLKGFCREGLEREYYSIHKDFRSYFE
ncbi:MAG: hypothetical protein Q7R93_01495 [bacterium]|nr:hypothetical protein [bacterium]